MLNLKKLQTLLNIFVNLNFLPKKMSLYKLLIIYIINMVITLIFVNQGLNIFRKSLSQI